MNLFRDREIIQLPGGAALQPWMARLIAKVRGPSVRDNYRRIGGGSPQLRITREQASALEDRLNFGRDYDSGFRVFIAMRYSRPSADEALEAIAAAGIRRIVTLTLFPHWSKATTGSSRNEFERVLSSPKWKDSSFEITHIEQYADNPLYLDAVAATVRDAWDGIPESPACAYRIALQRARVAATIHRPGRSRMSRRSTPHDSASSSGSISPIVSCWRFSRGRGR